MNVPIAINADLITPLGAYVRLREEGNAAFLLESVEQGRLGRYSFVGAGARMVSLAEAERAATPVVGYLAYDHATVLEPTVPLPETGADLPESRFVVADTLIRFDHPGGGRGGGLWRRRGTHGAAGRTGTDTPGARGPVGDGRPGGFPARPTTSAASRARRSTSGPATPSRSSLAARGAPTSASALELYRTLRRVNPSPYLFLLELGDLALSARRRRRSSRRGPPRQPEPDRRHDRAGPGDAERLLASEKDRAEHVMLVDLGRNDLSRVCRPGTRRVERFMEPERFSHVTHLVSEVVGELRTASAVRPAAGPASRPGRSPARQGARDADTSRSSAGYRRAPYAGAVGYAAAGRATYDTCHARSGRSYLHGWRRPTFKRGAGCRRDSEPNLEHAELPPQAGCPRSRDTLAER
jgi:anthranilate synthase component 1